MVPLNYTRSVIYTKLISKSVFWLNTIGDILITILHLSILSTFITQQVSPDLAIFQQFVATFDDLFNIW